MPTVEDFEMKVLAYTTMGSPSTIAPFDWSQDVSPPLSTTVSFDWDAGTSTLVEPLVCGEVRVNIRGLTKDTEDISG